MTSTELSGLNLLLQRLTWPSGLVRERACVSLGLLMADAELGAEIINAVLAWMAAQKLESVVVFGLLAFFQARIRGVSIPSDDAISRRVSRPSLLSWLIIGSLYREHTDDPAVDRMHSATAPAAFEADPFFLRYAQNFLPPIYLERAKRIDGEYGPGFLRQWMFEWTALVELTGFALRKPHVDFWTRQDDDHLLCLDLPLSEVYRSSFLRAIAWAADNGLLTPPVALWFSAQACPIDLGLWQVLPGKPPDSWPRFANVSQKAVDTLPGEVTSKLGLMWQRQLSEEWLIAEAGGRVMESRNVVYDLKIIGVIQACNGPSAPEIQAVCKSHGENIVPDAFHDQLTFGGSYEHVSANHFQEDYADWSIWRLAGNAIPNTVPRWHWWRLMRGVWLPSPFLARKRFHFRCNQNAVVIREDDHEVARWADWTQNLQELTTANLTPSTGQMLLISRSAIERAATRSGGVYAWICKIKTYHRKYEYSKFDEAQFALDFGTTRIVRDSEGA